MSAVKIKRMKYSDILFFSKSLGTKAFYCTTPDAALQFYVPDNIRAQRWNEDCFSDGGLL